MSLKTISRYGWLNGEPSTIKSIGTYGWFFEVAPPIPTYPIAVDWEIPVEYLTKISTQNIIPIEFGGEVTIVTSEKSVPIESLIKTVSIQKTLNEALGKNLSSYNIPSEILRRIIDEEKINIESQGAILEVLSDKNIPIEILEGVIKDNSLPSEVLQKVIDNIKLPTEFGGEISIVTVNKNIPIEILQKIVNNNKFPVEIWGLPLTWILDERSTLWVLDERQVRWILEADDLLRWILCPRDVIWTLDRRGTQWEQLERE